MLKQLALLVLLRKRAHTVLPEKTPDRQRKTIIIQTLRASPKAVEVIAKANILITSGAFRPF